MNVQQLEVLIDLVESKSQKVYTNYQVLSEVINAEFKTQVTAKEILEYYENWYCLDQKDREIHNKSLNIQY